MSKHFTKPFNPIEWPAAPHDFTGDNNLGIYTAESTQRYMYGTRYITWDGRVYKYYNAGAACYSYHGAGNNEVACAGWHTAPVVNSAGEREVTATLASRSIDDLAGAQLTIHDQSGTDQVITMNIVGNEATVSTTTKIYLEFPLPFTIAADDDFEVYENPYRELRETTDSYMNWCGKPCVNTTTGQKGWLQTWGPCIISGGEDCGSPPADRRTLMWGSNASLWENATKPYAQIASYLFTGSSVAYGPQIYLMCST